MYRKSFLQKKKKKMIAGLLYYLVFQATFPLKGDQVFAYL